MIEGHTETKFTYYCWFIHSLLRHTQNPLTRHPNTVLTQSKFEWIYKVTCRQSANASVNIKIAKYPLVQGDSHSRRWVASYGAMILRLFASFGIPVRYIRRSNLKPGVIMTMMQLPVKKPDHALFFCAHSHAVWHCPKSTIWIAAKVWMPVCVFNYEQISTKPHGTITETLQCAISIHILLGEANLMMNRLTWLFVCLSNCLSPRWLVTFEFTCERITNS